MTEAHTGWQNEDYVDQPGYHGAERFNMNVYLYSITCFECIPDNKIVNRSPVV